MKRIYKNLFKQRLDSMVCFNKATVKLAERKRQEYSMSVLYDDEELKKAKIRLYSLLLLKFSSLKESGKMPTEVEYNLSKSLVQSF